MAKQRATFGKLQRERDKKAKAAAKRERRAARTDPDREPESGAVEGGTLDQHDEQRLIAALESLHRSYDEGNLDMEEFEQRRQDITSKLQVP